MKTVRIYDATLREGSQTEGISFSTEDRLHIAEALDRIGINYVEGGFPGSNPKDQEFFRKSRGLKLKHAKIAAFGSTRRKSVKAENDRSLVALADSGATVGTIFGKSSSLHVKDVLRCSLKQNLVMIEDSIRFLKENLSEVVFDAEHFFDGYKESPEYAVDTLLAAAAGGADVVCLCDTNGGCLPHEVEEIVRDVKDKIDTPIGIHTHNDSGMAVANTMVAVKAGVVHVQGTMNGYGERCGNANLCTVMPNLLLKMGVKCITRRQLSQITSVSRLISEIANLSHDERQPYVGNAAFTHKGGMHIDAMRKTSVSYEHTVPELVGNRRRLLLSEQAGGSMILDRASKYAADLKKDTPEIQELVSTLTELEHEGYQFEGAEGSFELLMMKTFKRRKELFHRAGFRIIVEQREDGTQLAEATIKVRLGDREVHTAAEGDGPVNALDNALRKALAEFYPAIRTIKLADYKVRVLEGTGGTASKVRVLIESTDGKTTWGTVGVSENIIDASWQALLDSIEYGLMYQKLHPKKK